MRTAIISDVHGNYPALTSVMEDALSNHVDQFVFVGDYVFDLPFSNDVVQRLMNLDNSHMIKGNKEIQLCRMAIENQEEWIYDQMGCIYQTYRELAPVAFDFLRNLEEECHIQLNSRHSLYAVHYLKNLNHLSDSICRSSNYYKRMMEQPFSHQQFLSEFHDLLGRDENRAYLGQFNADVIVFGHNHLQCYGYCGEKLVINPGSCGLPLDFDTAAPYTILEETNDGFHVMEKRVEYDVESVISSAKKSSLYEKGRIWSEMVALALRTGRDYFQVFFEIAHQIALKKGESGQYFSNATWEEAYIVFLGTI